MAREIWKPLEIESEYPFFVSSHGRVKGSARTVEAWNALTKRYNSRHIPERIFENQLAGDGYEIISLHTHRKRASRTIKIAIAVCTAFKGPRPSPDHHCAHLDGNCRNNRADNLAWVTREENEAHKARHGTKMVGSRHHQARLNEAKVRAIRSRLERGERGNALAREYGVSTNAISAIRNRLNWRHI